MWIFSIHGYYLFCPVDSDFVDFLTSKDPKADSGDERKQTGQQNNSMDEWHLVKPK